MKIKKEMAEKIKGVWSAVPTPFDNKMDIDQESINRMVEHHTKIGINGLFLLGTNGEGPCLGEKQKLQVVDSIVKANRNRMLIAVQITDNSAKQMIENAKKFIDAGADILVISSPYFFPRPDEKRLFSLYESVINSVDIPFGIYDRGKYSSVMIPLKVLKKIYENEKVIIIKDSSSDEERMKLALKMKKRNKRLRVFNGNEFDCVKYLIAGYDGLLLGGGVFNGYLAKKIIDEVKNKNIKEAEKLQKLMNKIMYATYGGKKIKCWLAGEKYLLMKMRIFRTWNNLYEYQINKQCKEAVERVFKKYKRLLLPYEEENE